MPGTLRLALPYRGGFETDDDAHTINLLTLDTWSRAVVPTGVVLMWTTTTIPTGYLKCDGAAVSRRDYHNLFAIIGTTFGVGDGSTTFNLPDLRQRFPLGKADSGTGSTLGGTGGAIDHTHTSGSMTVTSHDHTGSTGFTNLNHSHGIQAGGSHNHDSHTQVTNTPTSGASPRLTNPVTHAADGNHNHNASTDLFDATHAHSISAQAPGLSGSTGTANPPFMALNFIIKT